MEGADESTELWRHPNKRLWLFNYPSMCNQSYKRSTYDHTRVISSQYDSPWNYDHRVLYKVGRFGALLGDLCLNRVFRSTYFCGMKCGPAKCSANIFHFGLSKSVAKVLQK